jgi:tetratricopeptide (TPR) repeat protein
MLLPTSSIIPLRDVAVEHRMYIPLAAVIAVVVLASYTGLNRLWAAKTWCQTAQAMTAVVIILILCGGTIVRNMDYKSPVTLWTQVVSLYPDHKRAHLNLAQAHTQAGTHEDALLHYQKSLPFDWLREGLAARYYYNFGLSLQALKQDDAAEATYREAIKHAPRHLAAATSYNQLGLIAIERKDNRRALQYFKASTRVAPYYAIGYKNLGILYARMDRLKLAQQSLHQAVRVNPDFVEAHFALAEVFEQQELYHLAAASYQTVMRLDPDYPDVQGRQKAVGGRR